MSVESLLQDISSELKAVRAARERYAIKLSPDFNCFDYIEPNELRLSQILADLLAPSGSHAQGGLFLDVFLRRIGLHSWVDQQVSSVETEDPTTGIDRDRRVDIRMRWTDGRELVIENKPWANDQDDQLRDYIKELQELGVREWHVVYLGGTRAEPSEDSLTASEREQRVQDKKLTLTTYGDLIIPWLTECMGLCESDRFRWFLGEFKAYVLEAFEGERDMVERSAVVQKVVNLGENVEAAFEIQAAWREVRANLRDTLQTELEALCKPKNWTFCWDMNFQQYSSFGVYYSGATNNCYRLYFEFGGSDFRFLAFGVPLFDQKKCPGSVQDDIRRIMGETFSELRPKNQHSWVWIADLEEELRDWSKSSIPWKQISEGKLGPKLFSYFERTYSAFDKHGKLNLLC